ncbi:DUF1523 family protein [Thiococcus pfennigii]|jgi:hypothetical protein|uniref:DUF1523 family protein n=1 Tax=Thiococcus pfennigii TaxID=1057 RepID=UPI00190354B6|nr:DUF1523 family protein [Thiococcus pfennigii]MBK1702060.1 hypothetical protein [Thiococcus pfennigii]MBK1730976.1 hypothetical protein [Thiococcus pfennigii]
MKQKIVTALIVIAVIALTLLWLRFGPDSWEVQISGVTGDGRNIQYRIETVRAGSSNPLIFRNEDAGFLPPYFKFDSADLQANASRIARNCPDVPVTVNGYSMRIPWLSMFPNATSIDAPERCLVAPSSSD